MPGRPAQDVGGAAPDEADQEILRAALERDQVPDRAAGKALLVQPAGQGLDVDEVAERGIGGHGFTVTSTAAGFDAQFIYRPGGRFPFGMVVDSKSD
jgi:hypothetical protein